MSFNYLKKEVIDKGLCTRCGSCVGLSKGGVEFNDPLGASLPKATGKKIHDQKHMNTACSGKKVPFNSLNMHIFNKAAESPLLGNYEKGYVGYATSKNVRAKASSGGAISAIVIHLLETKQIDGAIMLGTDKDNPCLFTPRIVRTKEEVIACAQSKYHISPTNTILSTLEKEEGKFAFIGIPCQIHSMRKLQMANHPSALKISLFLGIYCGNILHFDSIRSHLKRFGIKDEKEIAVLNYREGEWPGNLYIKLKNGKEFRLEKFHANYLIPFHIMKRCLTCVDLTNEFADISCGDGWSPVYEERGKGWSAILARTPQGKKILDEMVKDNKFYLTEKTENDLVQMHSHGLDLKKRGAYIRILFKKLLGRGYPEYNAKKVTIAKTRILLEIIISSIFLICGTKLAKFIINQIPLSLIGKAFSKFRDIWKNSTKKIKKTGLS